MEAEFLRWLKTTLQLQTQTHPGIGDDCSTLVLEPHLTPVITTDSLVDQVHFDTAHQPLEQIGWKSLAVNLSDIAAMGATPSYAVVSLITPATYSLAELQTLYKGILSLAMETGTQIVGGDFNSHRGPLTIGLTVIGQASPSQLKYRFATKETDRIFITGPLGRSIEGHHLNFTPCLAEGRILASFPAVHSITDVTDGLVIDLNSILPDGLGAILDADRIPCRNPSNDPHSDIQHALFDGEDFELLFTVDSEFDIKDLTAALPRDIYEIGAVNSNNRISIKYNDNNIQQLDITGYEH
ncbi:MAG: thiamine-phosphate kinase [Planctomycetaceae bacterium]|nr:thiamine-phosphate kinase [Planctomycetaceae bacterium]